MPPQSYDGWHSSQWSCRPSSCLRLVHWVFIAILSVCLSWLPIASGVKIQPGHIRSLPSSQARADAIRETFKRGWKTYRAHAWGHDQIGALSLKPSNTRNGWGATIVNGLSTLQVMQLTEEYADAVRHVHTIDFTKTNTSVSVFESTVGYLGGLLSAYEGSARSDQILLSKAVQLADKLMFAWQNQSILPYGKINFTNNKLYTDSGGNRTNLAEAGSLLIEFYKLSKFTSNDTYFDTAEATIKAIMNNQPIWPGLHSVYLEPKDARPIADSVSWGSCADSFYEYLNKYSLLTGNADPSYLDHWELAVDSSIKHLMRKSAATSSPRSMFSFLFWSKGTKQRTYLASRKVHGSLDFGMTHFECFVGGNFMLGGKMLSNETIINYGIKLTETCAESYFSTRSGVGPEKFHFIDRETREMSSNTSIDLNFYDQHGFIPSGGYFLRPEVIESIFYAYRITGDPIWQTRAWEVWRAIEYCCRVSEETGLFAWITDVNRVPTRDFARALRLQEDSPDGWEDGEFREIPEYGDSVESFWWAETLKYFYLIFSKPDLVNLSEFILTTEAHPLRIDNEWLRRNSSAANQPSWSFPSYTSLFLNHPISFLMGICSCFVACLFPRSFLWHQLSKLLRSSPLLNSLWAARSTPASSGDEEERMI